MDSTRSATSGRHQIPSCLENYDEESLKLYKLAYFAGITIDPTLFKNILDLLKAGLRRNKLSSKLFT